MLTAKLTPCYASAWFHDTGIFGGELHVFNLELTAQKKELIGRISSISCGNNGGDLYHQSGRVDIHGTNHADPLYVMEKLGGYTIEVALYRPGEIDTTVNVQLDDGLVFSVPVSPPRIIDGALIRASLATRFVNGDPGDGLSFFMISAGPVEVVEQISINGAMTEEVRTCLPIGRSRFTTRPAPPEADYIGVSINTSIENLVDVEHKHVFRGRL